MEKEIEGRNFRRFVRSFTIFTCANGGSLGHIKMLNGSPCINLSFKGILAFLNLGKLKGCSGAI
jgi:hypothetical protein